jgi:uncharacterized protein
MLFAIMCTDKPGLLELRMAKRPAHVEYLNTLQLKAAGPFLDGAGNPNGSLVVVEAADQAAAEDIAANDPYSLAGLFTSVTIRPWRWALKNPEAA